MQSNGARIAVVAVAVAALAALFIVLSGDEKAKTPTTVTAQPEDQPDGEQKPQDKPDREPEPKPTVPTIEVKGGEPVGGVQDLEFVAGERILFKITSDQDAEFHLHGYDVEQAVAANGETTFDLAADIEGVFELEDHETAAPIAEITVTPG